MYYQGCTSCVDILSLKILVDIYPDIYFRLFFSVDIYVETLQRVISTFVSLSNIMASYLHYHGINGSGVGFRFR